MKEETKCYCGHTTRCDCGPETLKEAAERLYPINKFGNIFERFGLNSVANDSFKLGAFWQQEQIGKSEFLQKLRGTLSDAEARRLIFEQFKKK